MPRGHHHSGAALQRRFGGFGRFCGAASTAVVQRCSLIVSACARGFAGSQHKRSRQLRLCCLLINRFGKLLGTILGIFCDQNRIRKSIKKSVRFGIDFGRILAPNLAPFGVNFFSKNRSKIKIEKRSIFGESRENRGGSPGSRAGLREGLKINKTQIDIDQYVLHARQCCGGLWECFGVPGPSKIELSCRRGAIFEKISFFRPDTVLD